MSVSELKRNLRNLASLVRRVERSGPGRNYEATRNGAYAHYERCLAGVLAIEDAQGVEAGASYSDRLFALKGRGMRLGLLSHGDLCLIERRVMDV